MFVLTTSQTITLGCLYKTEADYLIFNNEKGWKTTVAFKNN